VKGSISFRYYEDKIKQQEKIAIVVSARQNATDELDDILTAAKTEITSRY
jgi:aspartokinase